MVLRKRRSSQGVRRPVTRKADDAAASPPARNADAATSHAANVRRVVSLRPPRPYGRA